MIDPHTLPRTEKPVVVEMTGYQADFVRYRLLKALTAARAERERIATKYPHIPSAPSGMDKKIHSLLDLGHKLGLSGKDMEP